MFQRDKSSNMTKTICFNVGFRMDKIFAVVFKRVRIVLNRPRMNSLNSNK